MASKKNFAYVDGSYNPKTQVYGCGCVLVDQYGKIHIAKKSGKSPEMVQMRNVAGEILGAKTAVKMARDMKMNKLTLYHDYEGITNWALGSWKTNKPATKRYAIFMNRMMDEGLYIYFKHVKAHSGNKYNEQADQLAKEAVGLR